MAKLAIALTALFALFALTSQASEPVLEAYRLESPTPAELDAVNRLFGLEHRLGHDFEVVVPAEQGNLLRSLAPRAVRTDGDVSASIRAQLREYQHQEFRGVHRYHSFEEVQAWMKNIQDTHADIAKVVPYGKSHGGRPLSALRISASPEDTEGLPQVMVTAATHGDELITTEVVMSLAEQLVEGNGTIDRLSRIVQSKVIYFIPVVNADGFVARNRFDGRADPNRSYPYPDRPETNPTPSIRALIDFFHSKKIAGSLDFHAFGQMVMFPWAYTRGHIEPEAFARMDALTRSMAEQNRYAHGPIAETIYIAPGSSADYYFWKQGTLGIAVEVGRSKVPSPASFPEIFASQEESTWRFLEEIK
jgi:carboxypeptidase T